MGIRSGPKRRRAARRRDRRGGPLAVRRDGARRSSGRRLRVAAMGIRSEIVRFVSRYERLLINTSRDANQRVVCFVSFLRSFGHGLRLGGVDARVFCFSREKRRRRNDVARHRLAADGGRDRPGRETGRPERPGRPGRPGFLASKRLRRGRDDARIRETRGGRAETRARRARRRRGHPEEAHLRRAAPRRRRRRGRRRRIRVGSTAFAVFRWRGRRVASASKGARPLARSFARRFFRFGFFKRARQSRRRGRRRTRRLFFRACHVFCRSRSHVCPGGLPGVSRGMSERVRLARARARRSRSRRRRTARSRRFGSFRFLARAPGFPARVPQLEYDRDARAVAGAPLQREVQRGGPERLEPRERKHRRAETRVSV